MPCRREWSRVSRTTTHIHVAEQEIDGVFAAATAIAGDGGTRSLRSPTLVVTNRAAATTIPSAPGSPPSAVALAAAAVDATIAKVGAFCIRPSCSWHAFSFRCLPIHGRTHRGGGRRPPRSARPPPLSVGMYREGCDGGERVRGFDRGTTDNVRRRQSQPQASSLRPPPPPGILSVTTSAPPPDLLHLRSLTSAR